MTNKSFRIGYFLCFCLLFLAGCTDENREILVQELGQSGWSRQQPAVVEWENRDTLSAREFRVLVRKRNDFEFDRLQMILRTTAPDATVWADTLSIPAFSGETETEEAVSYLYTDINVAYRNHARLNQAGMYRFEFIPIMPEEPLTGITGVGLEITTQQ